MNTGEHEKKIACWLAERPYIKEFFFQRHGRPEYKDQNSKLLPHVWDQVPANFSARILEQVEQIESSRQVSRMCIKRETAVKPQIELLKELSPWYSARFFRDRCMIAIFKLKKLF